MRPIHRLLLANAMLGLSAGAVEGAPPVAVGPRPYRGHPPPSPGVEKRRKPSRRESKAARKGGR